MNVVNYLALDIGTVRIGVASASADIPIPVARPTIAMRENEFVADIQALVAAYEATIVIIGYPRNQSGEPTLQTAYVEKKGQLLEAVGIRVIYVDESLTSVHAHDRLAHRGKSYDKTAVDAEAATIILQDYLENQRR